MDQIASVGSFDLMLIDSDDSSRTKYISRWTKYEGESSMVGQRELRQRELHRQPIEGWERGGALAPLHLCIR